LADHRFLPERRFGAWFHLSVFRPGERRRYHGEKGTEGEGGWYKLDGRIDADGDGAMLANGIIGASAFAAGHSPAGNAYAYHVLANFTGTKGSGKRIEGRVCNLTFVKQ
jgi:hypothetical protein